MITFAAYKDLIELTQLAETVIEDMQTSDIPQWAPGYPAYGDFKKDIDRKALIIYKEHGVILGSMSVLPEDDPPYKTISSWLKDKSIVIHRIVVHPKAQKRGIAQKLLNEAISMGIIRCYESIKIDTHEKNFKMRKFLEKNGFVQHEYLEVIDRIAYELVLEDKR